jgi:cytochrome c oxidase assembly protein subunit 11
MANNKLRYLAVLLLLLFSVAVYFWIQRYEFSNVNNKFISIVLLLCAIVFTLVYIFIRQAKLIRNILLSIIAMSAFAFLLVPLYNVFCDLADINGKVDLTVSAAPGVAVDLSRQVIVEFVVSHNKEMPWIFKPKHHSLTVHPGELTATAYYANNPTKATMFAQAVPSMTPAKASRYFKKVECFCFSRQKLGPGETAHLNLRFYLDPNLPKDVQRVTLAYTIFDVTNSAVTMENPHG